MSDYFKNKNSGKEFGPGPSTEVMWLIADQQDSGTFVCYVRAKTAYEARKLACKYIQNISNDSYCFANVKVMNHG